MHNLPPGVPKPREMAHPISTSSGGKVFYNQYTGEYCHTQHDRWDRMLHEGEEVVRAAGYDPEELRELSYDALRETYKLVRTTLPAARLASYEEERAGGD